MAQDICKFLTIPYYFVQPFNLLQTHAVKTNTQGMMGIIMSTHLRKRSKNDNGTENYSLKRARPA